MKNILCIDTCNAYLSLACQNKDNEIFYYTSLEENRQVEEICNQVESILKLAKLNIQDVDLYGLNLGPGSFTGTRIGVSYLAGLLAFSGDKEVVQIDTFDILLHDAKEKNYLNSSSNISVVLKADSLNGVFVKEYNLINGNEGEDIYIKSDLVKIGVSNLVLIEEPMFPFINHPNKYICNKISSNALFLAVKAKINTAKKMSEIKILRPKYIRQPY